MTQPNPKIRLYVPEPYSAGGVLNLSENQSHYLSHVMRVAPGTPVAVFNGHDGEWLANVSAVEKKRVTLDLVSQRLKHMPAPDLWLAFAPIKNKTELVVEKAIELGVSKLLPVVTRHSVVRSINDEKLNAHAIEAAEQCGRHDVPAIEFSKDLSYMLGSWPKDRTLIYGDESGRGVPFKRMLPTLPPAKYAVLIGPEGGFSADEHAMLSACPFVIACCMGPRILRADTAAIAALACVQSWLGDWEIQPHFEAQA